MVLSKANQHVSVFCGACKYSGINTNNTEYVLYFAS